MLFFALGKSDFRVLRGGSWNNNPNNCRASNRNRNNPDNRNNNIGFRLARDLKSGLYDLVFDLGQRCQFTSVAGKRTF
jgi:hypothetical protein